MIPTFISPLQTLDPSLVENFGAKATSLAQLTQNEIPVPEGYALSSKFLGNTAKDKYPKHFVKFEEDLIKSKQEVIIRSSATGEDSARQSMAGQLFTKANVPANMLRKTIETTYKENLRKLEKLDGNNSSRVNLIVQKQVPAKRAGVFFTKNPVTKNSKTWLLEYVLGKGSSLVDGDIEPNMLSLEKNSSRILDKSRKEEIFSEAWASNEYFELVELPALFMLAQEIEALFSGPQDIEWVQDMSGYFWIVQSRPITT